MDVVLTRVLDQFKLYILLVLVSLMLTGMDMAGWMESWKGGVGMSLVSLQDYTRNTLGVLAQPMVAIREYNEMEKELALTREQLKASYVERAEIERLIQENEDLKQLQGVDIEQRFGVRLVARLIKTKEGFFLNKGTREGVAEAMVVVDPSGVLVGRVAEASPYLSKMLLLTDRDSVVGVRVLGKVTSGVLVGDGFRGVMEEVLQTDSLEVDDVLVTTSSEGVYPEGLVIGEVEHLEGIDSDVTKRAIVHLQANTSDTVFVLQ